MSYPVIRREHKVTRGYSRTHGGVDIAPKRRGSREPIFAVGDGRISYVGLGSWRAGRNVGLTLDGDNSIWWYCHLSTIGSLNVGDRFEDGDMLDGAHTGNTGFSFGTHLHLERFRDGVLDRDTDPWPFIAHEPSPETYRGKSHTPSAPRKPRPAPVDPGRVRLGSVLRLRNWTAYTTSALSRYLYRHGDRSWLNGDYRVIGISHGAFKVRGPGGDAWVSPLAAAGLVR